MGVSPIAEMRNRLSNLSGIKQWSQDETQRTDHTALVGFPHRSICLQVEDVSDSCGGQSSLWGMYVAAQHCSTSEWVCTRCMGGTSDLIENQHQLE